MSHCLLVKGQVVEEGSTIVFSDKSELKVIKIHPPTQTISVISHGITKGEVEMPIILLDNTSIIKKEDLSGPNIMFKRRRVS